jgi:hypothetical protein
MTLYAQYDPSQSPAQVSGWYDTVLFDYPNLPPLSNLLVVTSDQWTARLDNPSGWAVSAGLLVAYTPPVPPPTPDQVLAEKLAAGIALTSTGTPALNATYALDDVSTGQIFQIGLYANQFAVFPSGGTTQPYPDIGGVPHSFGIAAFVAFLRAVAPLVSALQTQTAVLAHGGTPSWPTQTATIA